MTMEAWLTQCLTNLAKRPDMWGSPFAVECQMLTLIDTWHVLKTGEPGEGTTAWTHYLYRQKVGGPNNRPLAHRDGFDTKNATPEFKKLISGYITEQTGLTLYE